MSRPKPFILLAVFAAILVAMALAGVANGGFYIAKHEGDTLHLLQIVLRMSEGEWPHIDFVTPIGAMAFLPIVALIKAGLGAGLAILWSQALVALVLLLPTVWVAHTRLSGWLSYLFGASVMILCLALVHGEADRLVSISMHYNRWAWAVAYIVVALAVLPPKQAENSVIDGLIIGIGMALLALTKVTYFIAFAPAVLVGLFLRRSGRSLLVAFVAGLAIAVVMTLFAGLEFWVRYLGDLLAVAESEVRPQPGAPLPTIVGAPAYLGGSIALLMGVIFLRQAGEANLGLLLLILAPGFIYVTFQNFGNDPQWLVLLALLLLVPSISEDTQNSLGWPMPRALLVTAVAALAFAAPSFLNLAYSPFRHATLDTEKYEQFLPGTQHSDLFGLAIRSNRVDGSIALDVPGSGLEDLREIAKRDDTHSVFNGESLPDCELQLGLVAWFKAITQDLELNGYGGSTIFAADIFSGHWLFGDLKRMEHGAPWYYGGLPGIQSADYVLIPLCPASLAIRKQILEIAEEREISLNEIHRSPLYILAEKSQ